MSVRKLFTKAELRMPITRAAVKKIKESGLASQIKANDLRIAFIRVLVKQKKIADAVAFMTQEEIDYYRMPPKKHAPAVGCDE